MTNEHDEDELRELMQSTDLAVDLIHALKDAVSEAPSVEIGHRVLIKVALFNLLCGMSLKEVE